MASLLIRNVDPTLHSRLKARAEAHGHSMEQEARELLRQGLAVTPAEPKQNLIELARALFEPLGGLDIPELLRQPGREPPDFSSSDFDPIQQ